VAVAAPIGAERAGDSNPTSRDDRPLAMLHWLSSGRP
jgi:hypothetical protein